MALDLSLQQPSLVLLAASHRTSQSQKSYMSKESNSKCETAALASARVKTTLCFVDGSAIAAKSSIIRCCTVMYIFLATDHGAQAMGLLKKGS